MSKRDPKTALHHMLDYAKEATEMVRGIARGQLETDRKLALALTRLVEVIGEAAARVPIDSREEYANVPWREIVGMRNRLIHGYDEVDLDTLWNVIVTDLPPLIDELEKKLS